MLRVSQIFRPVFRVPESLVASTRLLCTETQKVDTLILFSISMMNGNTPPPHTQPSKNSYVNFAREYRVVLKTSRPGISGKEAREELSKTWKGMDAASRQKYIDLAMPYRKPKVKCTLLIAFIFILHV